ncbi:VOC family protein [Streptomyces fuscigenes]|uniref:VOC family protein n=1 Tax=Streptomyces fuscigenes TaxID=1528880 RepID=UPI001F1EDEFF|nr:VOC family protein [Streptomyces fuscigenes]MCF3964658.1 VOC family protein [Streptomyces fuscigenes]
MAAFAEGTPCWLDVSLPDLEAGKRFYGALFGWTFRPGPVPAAYAEAYRDGSRVAGLVAKSDGRMPTAWGVYFATPDVVAAARRVAAAGGRMVREPVAVGTGVVALAADPGGAVFGLWQSGGEGSGEGSGAQASGAAAGVGGSGSGTGFELRGEPGTFRWTEVYTRVPEPVDAFYREVLRVGYSEVTGLRGGDVPFRLWSPRGATPGNDTAVAGRSVMTDEFPAALPGHFLNYFAVDDCDATAAAVVRLGGRVRQAPFGTPYGRAAVLTDDQGADFAVLAGPGAGEREEPGEPEGQGEQGGPEGREAGEGPRDAEGAEPPDGARGPWRRWRRRSK